MVAGHPDRADHRPAHPAGPTHRSGGGVHPRVGGDRPPGGRRPPVATAALVDPTAAPAAGGAAAGHLSGRPLLGHRPHVRPARGPDGGHVIVDGWHRRQPHPPGRGPRPSGRGGRRPRCDHPGVPDLHRVARPDPRRRGVGERCRIAPRRAQGVRGWLRCRSNRLLGHQLGPARPVGGTRADLRWGPGRFGDRPATAGHTAGKRGSL